MAHEFKNIDYIEILVGLCVFLEDEVEALVVRVWERMRGSLVEVW